jgi:hypothetical protein
MRNLRLERDLAACFATHQGVESRDITQKSAFITQLYPGAGSEQTYCLSSDTSRSFRTASARKAVILSNE